MDKTKYMKATTQDWLNYAEADLFACEKMINEVNIETRYLGELGMIIFQG